MMILTAWMAWAAVCYGALPLPDDALTVSGETNATMTDVISATNGSYVAMTNYIASQGFATSAVSQAELTSATGTLHTTISAEIDTDVAALSNALDLATVAARGSTYTGGITVGTVGLYTNQDLAATAIGETGWDQTHKVPYTLLANSVQKTWDDEGLRWARNVSGATVTNGTIVSIIGSTGHLIAFTNSVYTGDRDSNPWGMVTQDTIADNDWGFVCTRGAVHGLNTLGLTHGDEIWLTDIGSGVNGYNWCTNKPDNATYKVAYCGTIANVHANEGVVNFDPLQPIDPSYIYQFDADVLDLAYAGGTMTGAVLTTRDMLTTGPSADELVNAEWVRSLTVQGAQWYFTSTVTNGYGEKTANFVALSTDPPASLFTNSIASPVTSDTYLAGGVATQLLGSLRSPVTFEIYMNRVGGNVTTVIPVHTEVYYVYSGTTNHLGDWEVAPQTITATTPTKYTFTVPFAEPTITNGVYLVAYLKSGTVSGTAAGLNIYGGGVYASHLDIDAINAGETAADVAADLVALSNALDSVAFDGVPSATITTPGIVEKATDAEVATGTDTNRYTTPAQLAAYWAFWDMDDPYDHGTVTGTLTMVSTRYYQIAVDAAITNIVCPASLAAGVWWGASLAIDKASSVSVSDYTADGRVSWTNTVPAGATNTIDMSVWEKPRGSTNILGATKGAVSK